MNEIYSTTICIVENAIKVETWNSTFNLLAESQVIFISLLKILLGTASHLVLFQEILAK